MEMDELLRLFGYTPDWVSAGVVSEAFLREQYAEWSTTEDQNPEHYRAKAFEAFLDRSRHLSDALVERIFALTDAGTDECDLQDGRVYAVIVSGLLTDEQHFALAKQYPLVQEPPIQRLYTRISLMRKINATGLAENFEEIRRSSDSHIQKDLLERDDPRRIHVEWLATAGSNKAIRNRAAELLASKRFR